MKKKTKKTAKGSKKKWTKPKLKKHGILSIVEGD